MTRLIFKIRPQILLTLLIVFMIITILSVTFQIFIKVYLPEITGIYNSAIYTLLFVFMTSILIIWYIILLKFNHQIKVLVIPIAIVLNFLITIKLGHAFSDIGTKSFYKINKEIFNDLLLKSSNNDIKTILRFGNGDLKLYNSKKELIENNTIEKLSEELGFQQKAGLDTVIFLYEFSMWGGYGFYFTKNEINNPKSLGFGGHISKWAEIDNYVYYFKFE